MSQKEEIQIQEMSQQHQHQHQQHQPPFYDTKNIYKPLNYYDFKRISFIATKPKYNFDDEFVNKNNIDSFVVMQHYNMIKESIYFMWYNKEIIEEDKEDKEDKEDYYYKFNIIINDWHLGKSNKEQTINLETIKSGDIIDIGNDKYIINEIVKCHYSFTKINQTK